MDKKINHFSSRQYMSTENYEYFHYRDTYPIQVDYHNHDYYELYFFLSGKGSYIIEGKEYELQPGDILVINKNVLHKPEIKYDSVYERIILWLDERFLIANSNKRTNLLLMFETIKRERCYLIKLDIDKRKKISDLLFLFEESINSISYGSNVLKETYIIQLIVFINKFFIDQFDSSDNTNFIHSPRVSDLIKYINNNLNSNLSLDFLSQKTYTSKYHLSREFKKFTGFSLHQYILEKRLIHSRVLLQQGSSVTDACNNSGFGNYSNYIRTFVKRFGLSPYTYSKNHQQ